MLGGVGEKLGSFLFPVMSGWYFGGVGLRYSSSDGKRPRKSSISYRIFSDKMGAFGSSYTGFIPLSIFYIYI